VWSLEKNGRVHRLTFSKSLAEHIQANVPGLELNRREFLVGRRLAPGELSKSGAYAVLDARKGKILRITLFAQAAEIFRDEYRNIAEAWLA
jgi:hypothetical protein